MLLGLCFFGLFFVLYNIAIGFTTAARASLALATLPLQTMVVGALLGIEPLTARKTIGVGVAVLGVFAALATGLSAAPPGAWRGELIMTAAVLCMAFYNVWSRPFIQRSSALGFLAVGMGAGAAALIAVGSLTGSVAVLGSFHAAAMDRRRLSRRRRRRARLHPLGDGAGADVADARRRHHDGQSARGGVARHPTRRRADHAQSGASAWSRCLPESGSRPRRPEPPQPNGNGAKPFSDTMEGVILYRFVVLGIAAGLIALGAAGNAQAERAREIVSYDDVRIDVMRKARDR